MRGLQEKGKRYSDMESIEMFETTVDVDIHRFIERFWCVVIM